MQGWIHTLSKVVLDEWPTLKIPGGYLPGLERIPIPTYVSDQPILSCETTIPWLVRILIPRMWSDMSPTVRLVYEPAYTHLHMSQVNPFPVVLFLLERTCVPGHSLLS